MRAYHLLRAVMERSGRVAIARFVLRTKEYLVAVRPRGNAISLTTMRFHDEVRSADEVGIDKLPKAKKAEVDQAVTLIKTLQRDFDPSAYDDEHRKRLLAIIQKKRKGQEIEIPEEPEAPQAVPDLMAALEASIERMKKGGRKALAAEAAASEGDAAALKRLPKKDLIARAREKQSAPESRPQPFSARIGTRGDGHAGLAAPVAPGSDVQLAPGKASELQRQERVAGGHPAAAGPDHHRLSAAARPVTTS